MPWASILEGGGGRNVVTQSHSYLHQSRHRDSATANVTQRHSYLHQSRHRDSATANVTQRHSYLHQSRHRDSATAKVTHRHSNLHQTPSRDMVAAVLQAAQHLWRTVTCDAPSQLISLILLTASLELLGLEIRSRQTLSIPKRTMLLVSPLRRLAYRAVDRGALWYRDIVIPLPASAQWLVANLE